VQQVALAAIGFLVFALGVARQVRVRRTHRMMQRVPFGMVRSDRHAWSPMRWPDGRQAWRDEFRLWFKIAAYSALAGAIFTLVVTH